MNAITRINRFLFRYICAVILVIGSTLIVNADQEKRIAVILHVNDAIGPAINDYIHRGLQSTVERNAAVVILQLDTPGGLDTSMRDIIRDIIASPVPVILYVSPSGARAASAGTYMMYAAHIAAMAPGTNLGAATPVQIGGFPDIGPSAPEKEKERDRKKDEAGVDEDSEETEVKEEPPPVTGDAMTKKMVNDAIAYIRSLAEMRGRNADWAEKAVREGASLSSEKALQQGVIDIIAKDIDELLVKADGWRVNVVGQDITLDTKDLELVYIEPDWRNEFLSVITNPNIAYILMLLGIYGLFFELYNPGFVLPGVVGAICLLMALYAMQVLPVNYAGLGLIILGIAFMVAEVFAPSFGALGIGGVISFVIGSIILFDTDGSNIQVAIPVIVTVTVISSAFFLVALRLVIAAQRKPVVSGKEEMLGSIGEVLEDFEHDGRIHVHGEIWQAQSWSPLKRGDKVKVTAIDGLILHVKPLTEEN
ncbi:MAG: serine protease [Gammaproteobacteria bacterium RIFCSPLOWO2_12_47_11]|nr:MAG: serine protease [Gammaproteobacteria bacterium RIFCSPLOWO2_12_47_11]OGT87355.1 MAG: serine protease [Gammaproteobacteria bacterium RIFCSPLOWO2_12_FULL_47_76]